jgi:hypothetical protein
MNLKKLELLSAALRTIGGNFDIPTLHLIFSVYEEIDKKGENISIGEVKRISEEIAKIYSPNQKSKKDENRL